jgi:parallel beta-helix repeat protein
VARAPGVRPSNDNVITGNDGSWADANAFEGTFSERNVYYKNLANDSRYGFWLGWSSNNLVLENTIERNSIDGVAWSDGQDNRIEENTIINSAQSAIHLWVGELGVGNSRRYTISQNVIRNAQLAMLLENTSDYFIEQNRLQNAPMPPGLESTLKARTGMARQIFQDMGAAKRVEEIVKTKPKNFRYFREQSARQGRDLIRFGDFAPYDFRGQLRGNRPDHPPAGRPAEEAAATGRDRRLADP